MSRYSEINNLEDRKSLKGVPDLRRGKKPEHSERMKQVYAAKRARNEGLNKQGADTVLLREIARESRLEFADDDRDYVLVLMGKTTWDKLKAQV